MKRLMVALIRLYQMTISRILPPACRFTPSCSEYFIEALKKKGLIMGVVLGTWRILRCNPFSKGGYDPVEKQQHDEAP